MNAFLHNSHINYKSAALVSGSGVLAQPLGIHKTNSPVIQPSVEYTYDATNCYAIIFMLRITISRKGICCRLGVVNIYLGLTSIDNQPTKKSSSLRPHIGIARRNNRGEKKKKYLAVHGIEPRLYRSRRGLNEFHNDTCYHYTTQPEYCVV